jgi:hypothetical protein
MYKIIIFSLLIKCMIACNCQNLSVINGNGNLSNPFQICSTSQFLIFSRNFPLTSSYKLCRNLDFRNVTFIPFGNLSNPFEGNFDGNNLKISNYRFNFPTSTMTEYVGLFRATSGAYIHDLYLETMVSEFNNNGVRQYLRYVGALIGLSGGKNISSTIRPTIIKNIIIDANVTTSIDYYNGVFGYVRDTNVENCIFNTENIINFGSDAVNSITYYTKNSNFKNIVITAKLNYVGPPRLFDTSISYCSAGFGIVYQSVLSNIFYTFSISVPQFNTRLPINLGAFSAYLRESNITNVFFLGNFNVGNNKFDVKIGQDNNVSIGYVSGSQLNSNFQGNVYFVNT